MKKTNTIIAFLLVLVAVAGCKKDTDPAAQEPEVADVKVTPSQHGASFIWSVDMPGKFQTCVELSRHDDMSDLIGLPAYESEDRFAASIDTLTANTTYYYRIVVWNKFKRFEFEKGGTPFTTLETPTPGQDTTYYDITVSANPTNGGSVSGGGDYQYNQSCTLTATAAPGYTFDHWTKDGTTIQESNPLTFQVTESATYVANFSYNGGGAHEYVDLGLPSGLLWATCNVGADNPEDYGDYFAWGETQTKDVYDWSTYQYCNGSSYHTLTKYCNNSGYGYNGFTDNLTTLEPGDDAATANWGDGWRMPTKEEWNELLNNTTNTWTTRNGVNGRLFTASNGNSLFLPAAGYRNGSSLYDAGGYGHYWSSSLNTDGPRNAWGLRFNSGDCSMLHSNRYLGQSVRPVRSSGQN